MVTYFDFANSLPIVIIASVSLLIMIVEAIFPKKDKSEPVTFLLCIAALAAAMTFSFFDINKNLILYNNFLRFNTLTSVLNLTLLLGILITVISSRNYLYQEGIHVSEYYLLLMFSLLGMMLMINANDLLILFVGLELMSVCFYVLAGFIRNRLDSNESAIKYFLLGAFLTGFLLLGIAFIFGYTGSTNYSEIAKANPVKDTFY
ncbi:MAG TPA: proton-conducting transporter membrane subunit, partial [Ignavibacteria bacterium]